MCMNFLLRFCFHPTPQDRFHWAWIYAIFVISSLILAIYSFHKGYVISGILNAFIAIWNSISCWVAIYIHAEWKKENKKSS
jgi:hypothetical protein